MVFLTFTLVVTAFGLGWFVIDQWRRGRFRVFQPARIDRRWLEEHVIAYPAEVVSAALHDTVGADEVKAILARLMLQRKVAAEVSGDEITLRLLVPRTELKHGAERELVGALFVSGEVAERKALTEYWTERHKLDPNAQYSVGDLGEVFTPKTFSPADAISETLLHDALLYTSGLYSGEPQPPAERTMFADLTENAVSTPAARVRDYMIWAWLFCFLFSGHRPSKWEADMGATPLLSPKSIMVLVAGIAVHLVAMYLADGVRRRPSIRFAHVLLFGLPLLLTPAAVYLIQPSMVMHFVIAALYTGSVINVVLRARSRSEARQIDTREDLLRARHFFEQELANPSAPIPIDWLPHAVAFGFGDRLMMEGPLVEPFAPAGGLPEWSRRVDRLVGQFTSRSVSYD